MELKKIIEDVVREVLPSVVRDMVRSELGLGAGEAPGKKGQKLSLPMERRKRRPSAASERGIEVGQKWEGRSYTGAKGRVIEIVSLGRDKLMPKVLKSPGARSVAKPISYEMLVKAYNKVD